MPRETLFLFGAAEKGSFCQPILLSSLEQLLEQLGHPPETSEGIYYAIQTLLFERGLIYFRVSEEGYSLNDYVAGLKWLQKAPLHSRLSAICIPGVGDNEIIRLATMICHLHQCLLIISSKDLYDYLTGCVL